MNKKIFIIFLIIAIAIPCFIWGDAIIKCEILTKQFGEEFMGLEQSVDMMSKAKTLKVLEYSMYLARVYYKNEEVGNVFQFKKENGEWLVEYWNTIWSKSGSAEGFIWPYIR